MLSLRQKIALELERHVQDDLIRKHPLRQLFWESTLRCNVHCRHCGSDCRSDALQPDMPREDFLRVLDNIAEHTDPHKVFVIISGGEPLVRDDLEICGQEIKKRGYPWGMVTNALALTKERLEALTEAGLRSLTVSIDGMESNHNWLRGHKGSFTRCAAALDLMAAQDKVRYDVVTCVNQRNYSELAEMKAFLISKKVPGWRLFTIFPVGRAATNPELQISPDQMRGMMRFIRDNRREGLLPTSYACEGFLGEWEGKVRDHLYFCQAGVMAASVLIDGSISACGSIRADYHQGNIYKDDFWQVWQERFQPYRDREWMRKDECADCRYFKYCRGNGMHLRDGEGRLLLCNYKKLKGH